MMRVELPDVPGSLGRVAGAIGEAGGDIDAIEIVEKRDGFAVDDYYYDCGCQKVRHTYHDGGVQTRVVRHDGRVLADDHGAEHGH